MARLRIHQVGGSDTNPRLRVFAVSGNGTVPTYPRLRTYALSGSGTLAAILRPIAPQTVEPGVTATVTAVTNGTTVTNMAWRQISGPPVTIAPSGSTATSRTVSFTSPSAMPPGADVVLGATLTVGSEISTEQSGTVQVLPQTEWSRTYGGDWTGAPLSQS